MLQTPRIRVALDAHTVGRRQTGNERYVVGLADALAARSDVDLIAYVDAGVDWPGTGPIRVRRLRFRAPQLRIPLELGYRANTDRVQLLHVQYVAPIARVPVVTAVHDISFEDVPGLFSTRTTWRLKASVRASTRRSRALVTLSEFTRERILHHYDLAPERVIVAPAGVSSAWRRLDSPVVEARLQGLGLPASFVLAVGNQHPRKNLPRLIRSVARLRRSGLDDLGLVLAGQSAWRGHEVTDAIDYVAGAAWVHRLGYVADPTLEALYNRARVVAYPSLYEGFGLPVAEALAIGAIVVASGTTAIPEVAGDAAILVDPTDDDALTEGLLAAATDETLRTRLGEAGPRQAATLTWEAGAEATVGAYRIALG